MPPSKQVAWPTPQGQQYTSCRPLETSRHTWTLGGDATALDDYCISDDVQPWIKNTEQQDSRCSFISLSVKALKRFDYQLGTIKCSLWVVCGSVIDVDDCSDLMMRRYNDRLMMLSKVFVHSSLPFKRPQIRFPTNSLSHTPIIHIITYRMGEAKNKLQLTLSTAN